jgi:hypothetical protein
MQPYKIRALQAAKDEIKGDDILNYYVKLKSNISGGNDGVYITAENESEALKEAYKKLDFHKLTPDFLNTFSRILITKA